MKYEELKIPNFELKDIKNIKRISINLISILDKEDLRIVIISLSDCLKLVIKEYEEQRYNYLRSKK